MFRRESAKTKWPHSWDTIDFVGNQAYSLPHVMYTSDRSESERSSDTSREHWLMFVSFPRHVTLLIITSSFLQSWSGCCNVSHAGSWKAWVWGYCRTCFSLRGSIYQHANIHLTLLKCTIYVHVLGVAKWGRAIDTRQYGQRTEARDRSMIDFFISSLHC